MRSLHIIHLKNSNTMIRNITLLTLAALVGFAFTPLNGPVEVMRVNTQESIIKWKGYKVIGKHNGTVALKDGSLQFEDGQLTGGSFVMDMTSITVLDLTGDYKAKLEGHLKSDDFFGVEKHPTAKFEITRVVSRGMPGDYKIEGDLTVKGITKPIRFNARVTEEKGAKVAKADMKLDRTDYNVRYGSGSFFDNLGDKTIYDEFDLSVELVAGK
jgi:polyisoprenoid-binding protein YceI